MLLPFLGVLGLCLSAPPASARVIGRSAEVSIGKETASAVEKYFQVDTDPVATARVRRIGRRLAAAAKDPDFPFEFHVVEAPEINAFALPGGYVYVFRGLLQIVPNDDALAFVMAHEVSHVTRRHAIKQFEKNFLLGAAISGVLAGTGARGFGNAALVVQELSSLAFTRNDEKDADHQGIELMAEAGYNVRSAADAMMLIKRAAGDDKSIPALLRSHPAPDDRVKKLQELASEIGEQRASKPRTTAVPMAPQSVVRRLNGLEGVALGSVEWFPLAAGARWNYRVEGAGADTTLTVRCLDALAAQPAGAFRVEYELGGTAKSTRILAPGPSGLVSAPDRSANLSWRQEAVFTAEGAAAGWRLAGMEKIRTAAGEWECLKVERLQEGGAVETVSWYARGVGLVRMLTPATGATRELTSYTLPG